MEGSAVRASAARDIENVPDRCSGPFAVRCDMRYLTMSDIMAALPMVDDLDALEKSARDPALHAALEMSRPENWWGTGAGERLLRHARAEGLPLAWVPSATVIKALDSASSADGRLAVLQTHRAQILADCRDVLSACRDVEIAGDVALAREALDAVAAGHDAPGMALAVCLGEPLAAWAATPRVRSFESAEEQRDWERRRKLSQYGWAKIEMDIVGNDFAAPWNFQYQVLIAPIPRFFTPWRPSDGTAPPTHLSRHVVAHQAAVEHFTPANALLSLMLVTSILRTQQEWIEEMHIQDNP